MPRGALERRRAKDVSDLSTEQAANSACNENGRILDDQPKADRGAEPETSEAGLVFW